jgi:hypothetical protein
MDVSRSGSPRPVTADYVKPPPFGQCRPFEVPAPQAANSAQEFQMEKRHWNHNFASGVDLTFATYLAASGKANVKS